jgi:hypothetical protein
MQEVELPQQVSVIYLNRSANYQTGHQIAQREGVETSERATLSLPIVMGQGQAQQIAEISLSTAWIGRSQVSFELPAKYLVLEPSDVVAVQLEGVRHSLRITETTLGTGFALKVRGVLEDVSSYDAYQESEVAIEPPLPTLLPPTDLKLLDMPLLPGDALESAPLRVAMTGQGEDWRGAVLYASADAGQNWRQLISADQPAICGTVTTLPEPDAAITTRDQRSVLTVNLLGDAVLASINEDALFNGANAALVGEEVIQFQHARLIAAGKYELTGLLRGCLGTESAMMSHQLGEAFVLLDDTILTEASRSSLIGLPRDYRAVTIGSTLGQVGSVAFTHRGVWLKPYAPVHVKAVRDASGNLDISWVRRARTEVAWRDFVNVPLNEAVEAYEVEILQGGTVLRTITVDMPTASYSAAQQIEDFGAVQTSVTLRIYQLSATIGRGYPAEVSA